MTDNTIPEVVMESGWYYTDDGQYVQVWRITQDGGCWCSDMKYHCASKLYAAPPSASVDEEAGAFDTDFMRHIANLCRAAYDLCQPKPQRTPEDVREHYGELCLLELTSIADEIERRLTASSGKAGEVAGWVRGDTFVDAKFWTADTPPQGWTPVYLTAPPSTPVGVEWIMELADEYDAKGHHDRAYDLRRLAQHQGGE